MFFLILSISANFICAGAIQKSQLPSIDWIFHISLREEYKAKHPEVWTTVDDEKDTAPIPDLEEKMRPLTNRQVFEMAIGAPCPDWED